jgi:hypothetical protein
VQFSGALPGFGASATIITQECGTIPGTTEGTFIVTVRQGPYSFPIAKGELTAEHTPTRVTARFEGEMIGTVPGFVTGQEFNGSLTYNAPAGTGWTTVHFEDLLSLTVYFACTPSTTGYSCAPTLPPI